MNENGTILPYRPATVLTVLTVIGLCVFVFLDLLYIPGGIVGMYGAGVLGDGHRDPDLVELSVLIRGFSALGQAVMFVYTPICFCMLMYRCAKNARALGFHGFQYEPGWVVGWFFVPFAHLWMPYKAVGEVWQTSMDTTGDPLESNWWKHDVGMLFGAWWAAWIFGTLLTNASSRMSRSSGIIEQVGMSIIPFAALIQVISGILCIFMVLKLTKRQELQARVVLQALTDEQGEANDV